MINMKKLVFLLICFICIMTSCHNANKTETTEGFNFVLNFGINGRNVIDTYKGTFTKNLISAGTEKIDFIIPEDKMDEIYKLFEELEIYDLPNDINAHAEETMKGFLRTRTSSEKYILRYTLNGETKTIVCDDGGPWTVGRLPDTRNRLVKFATFIFEYIYDTDVYKNMQPAEDGYS